MKNKISLLIMSASIIMNISLLGSKQPFKVIFESKAHVPITVEYRQFGTTGSINSKFETIPANGSKELVINQVGYHPFTSIFFKTENPDGLKQIPQNDRSSGSIASMNDIHNKLIIPQQTFNSPYTHTFQIGSFSASEQPNTKFTISNCSPQTVPTDYLPDVKRLACEITQEDVVSK